MPMGPINERKMNAPKQPKQATSPCRVTVSEAVIEVRERVTVQVQKIALAALCHYNGYTVERVVDDGDVYVEIELTKTTQTHEDRLRCEKIEDDDNGSVKL